MLTRWIYVFLALTHRFQESVLGYYDYQLMHDYFSKISQTIEMSGSTGMCLWDVDCWETIHSHYLNVVLIYQKTGSYSYQMMACRLFDAKFCSWSRVLINIYMTTRIKFK